MIINARPEVRFRAGLFYGVADMNISALTIYPVKSLGPVALRQAEVTSRGLAGDRRWMLVDEVGRFVTRRELPALARIAMSLAPGGYQLQAAEGEAMLPASVEGGALSPVTVWRDTVQAHVLESDASRLVSEVAGRTLRLAYMPEATLRPVNPDYAHEGDAVSFADGFPILVTSETSLATLNSTLEAPVGMARFRANIVLSGVSEAWAECGWGGIMAGAVAMRFTKPCSRCIVITQQPETGERHEGNAVPMMIRRLGQYNAEGALFGMNAVPESTGSLRVGDQVSAS